MPKTRRAHRHRQNRNRRQNGAGYQTSPQFLGGAASPVANAFAIVPSTAVNPDAVRPVLSSTFHQTAGGRTRKMHGGFVPSIMGPFVQNAQAAIVPAALYMLYHTLVPKRSGKSRRSSRR